MDPVKFITKNGSFESGELVKLGPSLWQDIYINTKDSIWKNFNNETNLENKIVMYINFNKLYKFHIVLYNNRKYGIDDTFYITKRQCS
jgi:hypothetical protein